MIRGFRSSARLFAAAGIGTLALGANAGAQNLLQNPDFSAGNSGFASEYEFAAVNTTEGQYTVTSNPNVWNAGLSPCDDHTTGRGLMTAVNGDQTAGVVVWTQTVAVWPGSIYECSFWGASAFSTNPGQLRAQINGDLLSPIVVLPGTVCQWQQAAFSWPSGAATEAVISIVNENTAIQGNDFVLDDFVFSPKEADCPADLDGNGTIDGADLGQLLLAWNTPTSGPDLNEDGNVDGADLGLLLLAWGDCP